MAKIPGGIFGRPSGSVSNIVFGAARDRTGKVATSRAKVTPTNPNTAGQQLQRGKFGDALQIVRDLGPAVYEDDFDRAIGQLPGFQSLMSILTKCIDASYHLTAPPDTPLGPLHSPNTFAVATGAGSKQIAVTWSTELGADGTAADKVDYLLAQVARDADGNHPTGYALDGAARSTGALTITAPAGNVEYLVGIWFRGQGTAAGLLSRVEWRLVTSHDA